VAVKKDSARLRQEHGRVAEEVQAVKEARSASPAQRVPIRASDKSAAAVRRFDENKERCVPPPAFFHVPAPTPTCR